MSEIFFEARYHAKCHFAGDTAESLRFPFFEQTADFRRGFRINVIAGIKFRECFPILFPYCLYPYNT